MKRSEGIPWISLALGLFALGPGLVTWMFANDEARSFASDWVVISTPLLILAGALFSFAAGRAAGGIGLGAAALVSAGVFAGLFFVLSGSIAERTAYGDERRRFEDAMAGFCEGTPQALPDAPAFVAGGRGTMVVYSRDVLGTNRRSYGAEFSAWGPERPHIAVTSLVACVDTQETALEVCRYQGGRSLTRARRDRRVRLFALQTGTLVAEAALPGSEPDPCQSIEEFYGEGNNTKTGSTPGDETVATFLRSYVAP